jgi:hypothetical protein
MIIDYAWPPHPSVQQLRAFGAVGVARYICPTPNTKIITAGEYRTLTQGGMATVFVWENYADDFIRTGFDAAAAARMSVAHLAGIGAPADSIIYYALDWDIQPSQWATVVSRLRSGPVAVHGAARTGIYGPYDALEWARRDGVASWFWQAGMSTAWSGGRNRNLWNGAHLRQRRKVKIGDADCDANDIIQENYGQRGTTVTIPGSWDDYLPDTAMAILTGETPRFGYPDVTGPSWDNDALKNHNLKVVEERITALLKTIQGEATAAKVQAIEARATAIEARDLAQQILAAVGNLSIGGVDVAVLAAALAPLLPGAPSADVVAAAVASEVAGRLAS